MRRTLAVATALVALAPLVAHANDGTAWQSFVRIHAWAYSESVSVYGAFHELEGDLERGDEAYTHNAAEIGVRRGPWSVSLLARYDYHVNYTHDTAELAHAGENDLPLTPNRTYQIDGSVNHARTHGLKLRYDFPVSDVLDVAASVSYLRGSRLLHGRTRGEVTIDGPNRFSGSATIDYRYSEDLLLHRRVSEPEGDGYALDFMLEYRPTERWRVALSVEDWLHRMRWRDAPFTTADLTSATVNLDADGFINTTPLLSGREGERDFTQRLPARTRVELDYLFNPAWALTVENFNIDGLNLPAIGARWQPAAERSYALSYGTRTRGLTFTVDHGAFHFVLGLDDPDLEASRFFTLAASWVHHF